jgi:hypothetical protein
VANQKADLAAALAQQAGSTRRKPESPAPAAATSVPDREELSIYRQPGRAGTAPITAHFPKEVRRQLKGLANELDRTMHDLVAEAFNDLFQKYGKAEICPRTE